MSSAVMPTRTRASYGADVDEEGGGGETNWAAAAAAAAPPAPDDSLLANDDEEEEWVNTGEEDNEEEEEEEEIVFQDENIGNGCRPTWILRVALPGGKAHDDGEANVFIDSGMTAERLGRCIVQAVSSSPSSSSGSSDPFQVYNDNKLVGLFGKDDRVFYSLEFILAMDPDDGASRAFCVTKPVRRRVATPTNGADGAAGLASNAFHLTIQNLLLAGGVLFLAIVIVPFVVDRFDDWNNTFNYLLLVVPHDLPSLWQLVSYVLDWPARELYRYGPAIVGWEGRDLIDICTQMNRRYYSMGLGRGGYSYEEREYWHQNPEACETIYRMKEESFARMCRPIWYLLVLAAIFLAVQRFVNTMFAKPRGPQLAPVDRAVIDTYRALQVLAREHTRQDDRRRQQQQQQQQQMAGRR